MRCGRVMARSFAPSALLAVLLAGCIPSNVVAVEDRAVATPIATAEFVPATAEAFAGLYESVEITGAAAAALRKVYYLFRPGGRFTGAALLQDGGEERFATLSGAFTLQGGAVVLGEGAEPAQAEMAQDLLRLRGSDGTVVLRRVELR